MSIQIYKYVSPCGRVIPVKAANTFIKRFFGLMGKKEGNYGILLESCKRMHTFFMRYPLDLVYLDKDNCVVLTKRIIMPFRIAPHVNNAARILAFPSSLNAMAFLKQGDKITLE
ncbi:MAG: hypothetical protein GX184_09000 [Clostridiaceae bacterium]|nr:hypothetical protein [Clostridiaceae bacterium]